MKKLAVLALIAFIAALTGCNTVKGAGQDLDKAGEAIKDVYKKL
jgi:predicted small secreted protein